MGLQVKRNEEGLYKLISSFTDKPYHKGWITQEEAKAILINNAFWEFAEKVIELDVDFPFGYCVNGKREIDNKKKRGCNVTLELMQKNDGGKATYKMFKEILKKHDIKF